MGVATIAGGPGIKVTVGIIVAVEVTVGLAVEEGRDVASESDDIEDNVTIS